MTAKLKPFYIIIPALVAAALIIFAASVFAQSSNPFEPKISFPVAELGNCGSQAECKSYCDKPENLSACIAFAESHGLMSQDEAARAKKFAAVKTGPGGCTGQSSCDAYCSDISHIDECVSFAEKNGLMDSKELNEAKKVQQTIKSGVTPPGQCKSKQECDAFCSNPNNMEECIAFAEKAGFISGEELAQAKKVIPLMKSGQTPGQCKSKEQCDSYCADDSHASECADFAFKAGFINEKEAAMIKKTGGKGPGGCRGREECDAFCGQPENEQTCFEFGKQNGLIPEEDLRRMEEGKNFMREALTKAPPAVTSCIKDVVGESVLGKIQAGEFIGSRDIGEKIRVCMENNLPAGPGGCRSREECESFCSNPDNQEACFSFAKEQGQLPPEAQSGANNLSDAINNAPPAVQDCFAGQFAPEKLDKIKSGNFLPNQDTGNIIRNCFKQNSGQINNQNRPEIMEGNFQPRDGEFRPEGEFKEGEPGQFPPKFQKPPFGEGQFQQPPSQNDLKKIIQQKTGKEFDKQKQIEMEKLSPELRQQFESGKIKNVSPEKMMENMPFQNFKRPEGNSTDFQNQEFKQQPSGNFMPQKEMMPQGDKMMNQQFNQFSPNSSFSQPPSGGGEVKQFPSGSGNFETRSFETQGSFSPPPSGGSGGFSPPPSGGSPAPSSLPPPSSDVRIGEQGASLFNIVIQSLPTLLSPR